MDVMQEHWRPAARVLVGSGGAGLLACALVRRSALSIPLALAGGAMLLRAGVNMALPRILGQREPYVDYIKTIRIAAPIEQVFDLWRTFENFPKFMRNVRAVSRNADRSWHWELAGPLGASVQWDAHMTVYIPNELIAWTTKPGSQVQHAGLVRFQPDRGGTRIQVEMSYNPPGAALGHGGIPLRRRPAHGDGRGPDADEELPRNREAGARRCASHFRPGVGPIGREPTVTLKVNGVVEESSPTPARRVRLRPR
jgi:uncharacterized membrane protein